MAKARMLHKSISVSQQVNKLPVQARILFTWMIPHADDEGRLKGNPEYIKTVVVPATTWSIKNIKSWLEQIRDCGLIYYWQQNSEWFIEFIKWTDYQYFRKDRFTTSKLPSYNGSNDNQTATIGQPPDNQTTPQYNISEYNKKENNKNELNKEELIADKNPLKNNFRFIKPKGFEPTNDGEAGALHAWEQLEHNNPLAFATTYYMAYKKGLPDDLFHQFTSEIEKDPKIKNPGAIFNKKVEEYFEKLKGGK